MSVLDTPAAIGLAALAAVILVAALAIDIRDRRTERRRRIARQQANHPHPSTRMLRPSRDVFDRTKPNRYLPAQRSPK